MPVCIFSAAAGTYIIPATDGVAVAVPTAVNCTTGNWTEAARTITDSLAGSAFATSAVGDQVTVAGTGVVTQTCIVTQLVDANNIRVDRSIAVTPGNLTNGDITAISSVATEMRNPRRNGLAAAYGNRYAGIITGINLLKFGGATDTIALSSTAGVTVAAYNLVVSADAAGKQGLILPQPMSIVSAAAMAFTTVGTSTWAVSWLRV